MPFLTDWPTIVRQTRVECGEGVEEQEASCVVAGSVKWCSHLEKQLVTSLNVKHTYPTTQQFLFRYTPNRNKTNVYVKTSTRVFMPAFILIDKN